MATKKGLIKAFNTHFMEYVNDVERLFPNDDSINTAKNAVIAMKKINPKITISIWYKFITLPYDSYITNNDITFFENKDYSEDVKDTIYSKQILNAINRFRQPIKQMVPVDKNKSMKYIQNLTAISKLYYGKNEI